MSHSYNKIWIHAVWTTKYRQPILSLDVEQVIYDYMRMQFLEIGCAVQIINGMPDHVHCLYQMNHTIANADIIKQVKGATSYYININNLLATKFAWQTGYAAFAVSEKA